MKKVQSLTKAVFSLPHRLRQRYLWLWNAGAPTLPYNAKPGIYKIHLEWPLIVVGLIAAIEIYALKVCFVAGVDMLAPIALAIADVAAALLGAYFRYKVRSAEIEQSKTADEDHRKKLNNTITVYKVLLRLTEGFIILSATIKIILYAGVATSLTQLVFIGSAYLAAAAGHIRYTADLIIGGHLKFAIFLAEWRFNNSKKTGHQSSCGGNFPVDGTILPAATGRHAVAPSATHGGQGKANINGELADEEILHLLERQVDDFGRYQLFLTLDKARNLQW